MKTWQDIIALSGESLLEWAATQSWAIAMSQCMQDAQWHAEGDVWTHTQMVCRELEWLSDWHALDRNAQLLLMLTALFHDAGKPATTAFDAEAASIAWMRTAEWFARHLK